MFGPVPVFWPSSLWVRIQRYSGALFLVHPEAAACGFLWEVNDFFPPPLVTEYLVGAGVRPGTSCFFLNSHPLIFLLSFSLLFFLTGTHCFAPAWSQTPGLRRSSLLSLPSHWDDGPPPPRPACPQTLASVNAKTLCDIYYQCLSSGDVSISFFHVMFY